jgi:hypothetical protein
MVYQKRRQKLGAERGEECIVMQDFWRRRQNNEAYKLCSECPQSYKICCSRHNAKKT